jgi:hypothetical protein
MPLSWKPSMLWCIAPWAKHVWNNAMQWIRIPILKSLLAMAVAACLRAAPLAAAPQAASVAGAYTVKIAGCLTGTGNATMSGTTLSISGTVSDDSGHKGNFTATNLTVDAKLHFTGTGTALGLTMTLSGRLDPSNPQEAALKTERVVCTFTTSNDGHGRVAGYVPVDPATLPPAKGGPGGGSPGGGSPGGGSPGGGGPGGSSPGSGSPDDGGPGDGGGPGKGDHSGGSSRSPSRGR